MATILTYNPYATIASLLTTELNALADAGFSAASAAQGADGTGGPLYGDFELVLASLNPTVYTIAELYLIRAADGTNYEDAPSATNPASNAYVGTFIGSDATAAARLVLPKVELPPGLWKAVIKNTAGVAMGATLNTLKVRPYNLLST